MKILAVEREVAGVDDHAYTPELLHAEAARAWALYQEGIVREIYFRADKTEAVLILECESVEEAAAVLDTLPLVRAGLVAFEPIALMPYPGFARLFGDSQPVS